MAHVVVCNLGYGDYRVPQEKVVRVVIALSVYVIPGVLGELRNQQLVFYMTFSHLCLYLYFLFILHLVFGGHI